VKWTFERKVRKPAWVSFSAVSLREVIAIDGILKNYDHNVAPTAGIRHDIDASTSTARVDGLETIIESKQASTEYDG
jgi:hypothetical protein